ncbi:hypothetical protein [Streptomyces sp. Wh19]|uniref:Uncharacterized protein n=1 Tax=Streptomyces sanglieri TaxID=193460 RepID=A0ABW2WT84_9ACTN|nr:hypothetical protein [Streptomyces sp. Wh19]MDV9198451.1 hypothetical protein [Streptomyces sp. Wh19]
MVIAENVVSGLLVMLIAWGSRHVWLQWRRRRLRHAADRETGDN